MFRDFLILFPFVPEIAMIKRNSNLFFGAEQTQKKVK